MTMNFVSIYRKIRHTFQARAELLEEAAVLRAVLGVIKNKTYYPETGTEVRKLEEELSRILGRQAVVAVSSGTDALILSLKALGVGAGDEVIVPAFSFISSASAIAWVGAKPVFVDITPHDFTLDPARLESAITPNTRAIIAVHLFGQPADMERILAIARRRRLAVIEDTAQAFGAEVLLSNGLWHAAGSMGDFGCLSFSATKPFSVPGNGGAIVTKDKLAAALKMLRNYGAKEHYYDYPVVGTNGQLHEIHAAALRARLPFYEQWLRRRKQIAELYRENLSGVGDLWFPSERPGTRRTFYRFVLRTSERDELYAYLIGRLKDLKPKPAKHYPIPLPFFAAFSPLGHRPGDFPESERAASETLDLPLNRAVSFDDALNISRIVQEFFSHR